MENFRNCDEIEFDDDNLDSHVQNLKQVYIDTQNNFAQLCLTIYNIWSYCKNNYFKSKKGVSYNAYSLLELFGFDRKAVSKYKKCYTKFCIGTARLFVYVRTEFELFSPSKLFELLPLSEEMLLACIDKYIILPTMTVKEIRQKVKDLAGKTNPDDLVAEDLDKIEEKTLDEQEAELPEAFDPKKTHTYEYFKAMSKEALITCLFQCEDYIKKLTTKKAGK